MIALRGLLPLLFQSTLPVWGATTANLCRIRSVRSISIHAPRVGSDTALVVEVYGVNISIHAPRVGSDGSVGQDIGDWTISIHDPRVGSDKSTVAR